MAKKTPWTGRIVLLIRVLFCLFWIPICLVSLNSYIGSDSDDQRIQFFNTIHIIWFVVIIFFGLISYKGLILNLLSSIALLLTSINFLLVGIINGYDVIFGSAYHRNATLILMVAIIILWSFTAAFLAYLDVLQAKKSYLSYKPTSSDD